MKTYHHSLYRLALNKESEVLIALDQISYIEWAWIHGLEEEPYIQVCLQSNRYLVLEDFETCEKLIEAWSHYRHVYGDGQIIGTKKGKF